MRTHLSLVRMDELRETRLQIVQRLGRAAEYKDNETGMHVIRMSHFSQLLALAAGAARLGRRPAQRRAHARRGQDRHPDAVLRKPGPLDADEWATMRRHPEIGAEIIGEHPSGVLQLAREIAPAHHEKWDGSGYPRGLAGEAIPLSARIVAIADVFDAPPRRPWEPRPVQGR